MRALQLDSPVWIFVLLGDVWVSPEKTTDHGELEPPIVVLFSYCGFRLLSFRLKALSTNVIEGCRGSTGVGRGLRIVGLALVIVPTWCFVCFASSRWSPESLGSPDQVGGLGQGMSSFSGYCRTDHRAFSHQRR
ncbi:unnamed protein product [Cuscuta europaea]|uniref:Uncharacterized protein n=1 Tax=Cuscuta europaea TaxID=41803 RepID=A0A9P0YSL3_CUSEU|nr:unnamed protein product [Cuscuta europaea]